jgi:hypothetical protein
MAILHDLLSSCRMYTYRYILRIRYASSYFLLDLGDYGGILTCRCSPCTVLLGKEGEVIGGVSDCFLSSGRGCSSCLQFAELGRDPMPHGLKFCAYGWTCTPSCSYITYVEGKVADMLLSSYPPGRRRPLRPEAKGIIEPHAGLCGLRSAVCLPYLWNAPVLSDQRLILPCGNKFGKEKDSLRYLSPCGISSFLSGRIAERYAGMQGRRDLVTASYGGSGMLEVGSWLVER